jgi:hypothetical protein
MKKRPILCTAALVAAMALTMSSTADAGEFHSEVSHSVIVGSQIGEDVITVKAGTIKCGNISYPGTASSATSTTISVQLRFHECKAFGFINTQIDEGFCEFEYSGDNNRLNLWCGVAPIEVTAFNCWETIGSQSGIEGVTYTNTGAGGGRNVDVSTSLTGLTYTQHSKSFPGCTNGTFTNGTWSGSSTLTAVNTFAEPVGLWRQ